MSQQLQATAERFLRAALNDPNATFRDGQWEAIARLVEDRARLLVVQRTGWGKSVVYFIATRLLRDRQAGPTVLISPLLALMRNQIDAADRLGLSAASINSTNSEDWEEIIGRLHGDEIDLLLISPERLANEEFRTRVLLPVAGRIGLFVVDEAHCISDWGHDFRPDYRRITRILQGLPPNLPVLATTATANDRVIEDIKAQLGANLHIVRGPLGRESLRLQNISLPSQTARLAWLAENVPKLPGSGIIYTLTIEDAERVATWMRLNDIPCDPYHSRCEDADRTCRESRLMQNEIKALVATTSLGMGYDKPDLGFVIHFQRPGSIVHYYQQVGRAGRAIDAAYGILLCGDEDREITDYFIENAFPPEGHIEDVLRALNRAHRGVSFTQLQRGVNLSDKEIRKVLTLLTLESPSPVKKVDGLWYATPVSYTPDWRKIAQITALRRHEQARMDVYARNTSCLMTFLQQELDDQTAMPCRQCAPCMQRELLPSTYSLVMANRAVEFLRRNDQVIAPRRRWPQFLRLPRSGFFGEIPRHLHADKGRALCIWGDAGWGEMVRRGKQKDHYFSDELVEAALAMIRDRWQPSPAPAWVTCIPSTRTPLLVLYFAERLARALELPFNACLQKTRRTEPQKTMNNSAQQVLNLDGAFSVSHWQGMGGPVLLVDDIVDSRWTFTMASALLRQAGSGTVFPLALAMLASRQDN